MDTRKMVTSFLFATLLCGVSYVACDDLVNLTFPSTFKFGTASSAYQVEGGWDADGKGVSLPDSTSHVYPFLYLNSTGDVACDSYHKYLDDVENLKTLGVQFYRFSISWPRILPTGFANQVNQAGIDYYLNLIKALKAAGIEPMVTMFHFDIPMAIDQLGGFNNPEIARYFTEYADVLFRYFGDYVQLWTTFNEPLTYCATRYDDISAAYFSYVPTGSVEYTCGHNLLRAHARTYRWYQKKYKATQNGRIAINFNAGWNEPASNSTADIEAAYRKTQFELGWFAHPIFVGDYPQVMKDTIANLSRIQNFTESRLPKLTQQEIEDIKGTCDYFALNHYTTYLVLADTYSDQNVTKASYNSDLQATAYQSDDWVGAFFTKIVPWGLGKQLKFIQENYGNPEILITENGYGYELQSPQNDTIRMDYIQAYLNQILISLEESINITAYTYWSLMDSFEWSGGYYAKAGLFRVDFSVDNRTRTPNDSVDFYKNIIQTRCLLDVCNQTEAGSGSNYVAAQGPKDSEKNFWTDVSSWLGTTFTNLFKL